MKAHSFVQSSLPDFIYMKISLALYIGRSPDIPHSLLATNRLWLFTPSVCHVKPKHVHGHDPQIDRDTCLIDLYVIE